MSIKGECSKTLLYNIKNIAQKRDIIEQSSISLRYSYIPKMKVL